MNRESNTTTAVSVPSGTDHGLLERVAFRVTQWAGGNWALVVAIGALLGGLAAGGFFGYSSQWQVVINTGVTFTTFIMVFLIQRSQAKESRAMQLKLNEIVAALKGASNRLIGAEALSLAELNKLTDDYGVLVDQVGRAAPTTESHSVEEMGEDSVASQPATPAAPQ